VGREVALFLLALDLLDLFVGVLVRLAVGLTLVHAQVAVRPEAARPVDELLALVCKQGDLTP
jgi:hypothetical protein